MNVLTRTAVAFAIGVAAVAATRAHADEQIVPITRLDGSKGTLSFEGKEDGSVKIDQCVELRTTDPDVCVLVCTGHDSQGPGHIELPFRCIDSQANKQ